MASNTASVGLTCSRLVKRFLLFSGRRSFRRVLALLGTWGIGWVRDGRFDIGILDTSGAGGPSDEQCVSKDLLSFPVVAAQRQQRLLPLQLLNRGLPLPWKKSPKIRTTFGPPLGVAVLSEGKVEEIEDDRSRSALDGGIFGWGDEGAIGVADDLIHGGSRLVADGEVDIGVILTILEGPEDLGGVLARPSGRLMEAGSWKCWRCGGASPVGNRIARGDRLAPSLRKGPQTIQFK